MKVDVMLTASVIGAAERAQELETIGADGIFSFENAHDLFFPLVAAAPVCGLDIMTNVAIAFPRSPMHLAHAAFDLQQLSHGRFRLGLGSQVKAHIERRYGAVWGRPVEHMRESVVATKAILDHWQDGSPLNFEGDYTLHTLMTPMFNPGPNPYGVSPVLVGALGPRMTEMAAEVADGLLVMPFNSARHMTERTLPAIQRGLARSGRSATDFEIIAEVIVGVGRDDEELSRAMGVRSLLGFYGSTPAYRPVLDVHGWGDLQHQLNALSKRGDWDATSSLITDEMVETLAVVGTPDQVAEEIHRRYGAYATRICAYFPGYEAPDDLLDDLISAVKDAA